LGPNIVHLRRFKCQTFDLTCVHSFDAGRISVTCFSKPRYFPKTNSSAEDRARLHLHLYQVLWGVFFYESLHIPCRSPGFAPASSMVWLAILNGAQRGTSEGGSGTESSAEEHLPHSGGSSLRRLPAYILIFQQTLNQLWILSHDISYLYPAGCLILTPTSQLEVKDNQLRCLQRWLIIELLLLLVRFQTAEPSQTINPSRNYHMSGVYWR